MTRGVVPYLLLSFLVPAIFGAYLLVKRGQWPAGNQSPQVRLIMMILGGGMLALSVPMLIAGAVGLART